MLRTATTRLADRARRLATSAAPRLASRPRGPRAAAFGAAVTAAFLVAQNVVLAETPSGSEDAPKRKPIYDDNETKLPPPPPPSDLELFIRKLRHTVTASWDDARDGASGLVDRWIKFEQATEAAIKSVVDSKEPFLPGAALLGGSFLAGVAVARKRESCCHPVAAGSA
ncbi:hypothetical protein DFJ74DRAFT_42764 [Hyaloraphidium curvatum]|nr:hypothetical protein DFJ74DRAFT_42764 [Hyaloraphidium curvatum]